MWVVCGVCGCRRACVCGMWVPVWYGVGCGKWCIWYIGGGYVCVVWVGGGRWGGVYVGVYRGVGVDGRR